MDGFERIAILDYEEGEVIIASIPKKESARSFMKRKGIGTLTNPSNIEWMRGDIKLIIEDGINKDTI